MYLYSIYMRERRRELPKLTFREASTSWKQLSEEDKQIYVGLYQKDQARYQEEYKVYVKEKMMLKRMEP